MNKAIEYVFRPIEKWPREETKHRKDSRFEATYEQTTKALEFELKSLRVDQAVIQLDLEERDIRVDGRPRSDSKPRSAKVILSFRSPRVGPIQLPCDRFTHWKDNLRAITLSLEALRKLDRYGVTKWGEQYRGWRQIEGEVAPAPLMSVEDAARVLAGFGSVVGWKGWQAIINDQLVFLDVYRVCAKKAHPDMGGERDAWDRVQSAHAVLKEHHRGRSTSGLDSRG